MNLHDKTPQQLNMIEVDALKAVRLFSRDAGDLAEGSKVVFSSEAEFLIRQIIKDIISNQNKEA